MRLKGTPMLDWQQAQLMLMILSLFPYIWAMERVSFSIVFCIFKRKRDTPQEGKVT